MREFCKAKASAARRGREKFPSGNLFVTKSLPLRHHLTTFRRGASQLLGLREDLKAGAMREFCKAKASAARRGREKFPSGNLFVTKSLPLRHQSGDLHHPLQGGIAMPRLQQTGFTRRLKPAATRQAPYGARCILDFQKMRAPRAPQERITTRG